MESKEKRKSNFEWLRILAMAMIITLHYFFKGNVLADPATDKSLTNLLLWLLTYFCIGAVNVYVFISGYFLVETEFRIRRLLSILAQVLEYSILIAVVMIVTGQVSLSELTVYDWIGYIFPVGTEEYWFITAYIMMYVLTPVLGAGAKALSERKLKIVIHFMFIIVVIEKLIIPMTLPTDRGGYDFGWFILLFLLAAYIRIYGFKNLEGHKFRSWCVFIISSILTWVIGIGSCCMYSVSKKETFTHYFEITKDYNFVLVLTAAIGLFYAFKNANFKEDTKLAEFARRIGSMTLGVYLLHEHPLLRYRWQEWLNVGKDMRFFMIILNWLICVAVIYLAGLLVEWIRGLLLGGVTTFLADKFWGEKK